MTPRQDRWQHFNPVRVVAGPGSLAELPRLLPARGTMLIVTTAGATRRGLTARVRALLESETAHLVVHDSVTPNPELDPLDEVAEGYRGLRPAGVIAVGGGSAIDAGKTLAAVLDAEGTRPLHCRLRQGQAGEWNRHIPVVTIPTTAGTGAEVTPFATVWDPRTQRKFSVTGESLFPSACILDPELTLSLGPSDTLYPALDTISHALESLWNRHATPVTEALAFGALRLSLSHLREALEDGNSLEARTGLQQASLLAAQAIAQTRTAIAHSISYPLTLAHGVPHGLACSFTLPALLDRFTALLTGDIRQAALLSDVAVLLRGLALDQHLYNFASREQVLSLLPLMNTPGRADNFCFEFAIEDLVKQSLPDRQA